MTEIHSPIHVETVGNVPVRFFKSPTFLESGRPDMPWHVCDDVWKAIGLDEVGRLSLLTRVRARWSDPRTVATADGVVVVAPFLMGDIIIEAWLSLNRGEGKTEEDDDLAQRQVRGSFRRGNTAALKAMTPHIDARRKLAFALEAMDTMEEFRDRLEE